MSKVWYGSFINRLQERSASVKPEVGMGVTECLYSDREPWEVIEVINDKHIVIRELDWKRIDDNGMSESQEYEYFSKPDGAIRHLVLRKNGKGENCGMRWRDLKWERVYEKDAEGNFIENSLEEQHKTGEFYKSHVVLSKKLGSTGWRVGSAERYYDFSF